MAGPPSDDAAKQRIISHMNADHPDSVIRYAEYYGQASRFASRSAKLTDVTLDKLVLVAGDKTLVVPLDPPMKSFRDARERLVDMDKETIEGLKRSTVTLKEYRPPQGFPIAIFTVCLATYIMLSRKANMMPGSLFYDVALAPFPNFAAFALKMRDVVLWPMIAIHVTEAYFMTKRLEKHSVPLFSQVWWMWTISCFIEGFDSFKRITAIEQEKKQKQAKH